MSYPCSKASPCSDLCVFDLRWPHLIICLSSVLLDRCLVNFLYELSCIRPPWQVLNAHLLKKHCWLDAGSLLPFFWSPVTVKREKKKQGYCVRLSEVNDFLTSFIKLPEPSG
jgi:hypothetical protein